MGARRDGVQRVSSRPEYGDRVPRANDKHPAASASAVLVCQGRAVADGRYAVGRFTDPVARRLLDPAELDLVDAVRDESGPPEAGGRIGYEMLRGTGAVMVPRTIAIDDAVRDHAARQLVILGAGLDDRVYRMPELTDVSVFEVDHAASQADKQRRAAALEPLARLTSVTVDLSSEQLENPLRSAGFDPSEPTTWVWEGVVPYLTRSATIETLAQLTALSAVGSRLVVNYQAKSAVAAVLRRVMRFAIRMTKQADPLGAEPWRSLWRPQDLAEVLTAHGFDVLSDEDLLTLADGLDLPRAADRSLRTGRVAVARLR